MISVVTDLGIFEFLRGTHDRTAETLDAVMAGRRMPMEGPRGERLIHSGFTCSREQAIEVKSWLRGGAYMLRETNEEFSGQLLKTEGERALALTAKP